MTRARDNADLGDSYGVLGSGVTGGSGLTALGTVTAGTINPTVTLKGDVVAKAWVNFDGTGTVAIRDSLNVSSLTDNAAGDYTISFGTNLPNANYCLAGFCGGAALNVIGGRNVEGYNLVGSTRIGVRDASAESWEDTSLVTLIIIGGEA